jgi:hypothetical protein
MVSQMVCPPRRPRIRFSPAKPKMLSGDFLTISNSTSFTLENKCRCHSKKRMENLLFHRWTKRTKSKVRKRSCLLKCKSSQIQMWCIFYTTCGIFLPRSRVISFMMGTDRKCSAGYRFPVLTEFYFLNLNV